jgi:hypothetical protein
MAQSITYDSRARTNEGYFFLDRSWTPWEGFKVKILYIFIQKQEFLGRRAMSDVDTF